MSDITLESDSRLVHRRLAKGFLPQAEYQAMLDKLPDSADRGEWIDVEAEEEADAVSAEATPDAE